MEGVRVGGRCDLNAGGGNVRCVRRRRGGGGGSSDGDGDGDVGGMEVEGDHG